MLSAETLDYGLLSEQAKCLIAGETNRVANLANISALIYHSMPDLNWAGFYLLDSPQELVLGPFQGKVACVRIPVGKGVCGTAVSTGQTQLIDDVHAFAGHIACDSASESELVVPVRVHGEIVGVLDIDSPKLARFSERDARGIEKLVQVVEQQLEQQ
ncbi:GAF domain-containing protein [Ferrimonas lipolytica]|uniref:GAF domain-containing protein n=1 Tax=Ferrimonas lipolytica TaxID=2724191 RepID=A0A6H1UBZ0_9GAMM|nr:GAF domain-containing protein [Ferrimonas lipolytica]QIZ76554.1 GAF domain-containing protein [Ferrimonas lipolytica]